MDSTKLIVWLVVGSLAGTLTGRIVTFSKQGLGRWLNLGVGMIGALIGGFLFHAFNIDLGLGGLKISVEDLVAAVTGSLLFVGIWWLTKKLAARRAGRAAIAKTAISEKR